MMSELEYHIGINDIIKSCDKAIIDASYIEVDYQEYIKKIATELEIETEEIQDKLRLISSTIKTKIFSSIDKFLETKEIDENSNFLILDENNIISFICGTTYENFKLSKNFLITNLKAYLEFQDLLKKHETEAEDAFQFVDSFNKDLRKITFISLSDKGRLNITYDLKAPNFDKCKDLRIGFNKFKGCFDNENKSLIKFLKSALISVASNFPNDQRIKMLFESINEVVDKARINFEVYLNNLSIDKIKKDYDEVKSKYFNGLSDILSKLSQKIIALPIAVSATLLAVDKIKDSDFFLFFLLGAIIITSIFISLLLRVHFKDLIYISKIFHFDYESLLENNFFLKYPEEKKLFEEIKSRITDRISLLKIIIESYYWIMNIANIIIICLIFNKLGFSQNGLIYIIIGLLLCMVLFRNYVLDKND